jgi:hypothetical protein
MTTYNSYEEAKIANPGKNIIRFDKQNEFKAVCNEQLSAYLTTWKFCNPADHCMTVEKFLKDGHKLVGGDLILNANGYVSAITRGDSKMLNGEGGEALNHERFILRAAALNKPKRTNVDEKTIEDSEYSNSKDCRVSSILTLVESKFGSGALFAVADVLSNYKEIDT